MKGFAIQIANGLIAAVVVVGLVFAAMFVLAARWLLPQRRCSQVGS